jgi:ribosomal protein L37E
MTLPWAGFSPLRKGRIHVFCPRCHRKVSNAIRGEYDPLRATLVHTWCDRCGQGGKDAPEYFYATDGKEISRKECERALNRALKAKGIR